MVPFFLLISLLIGYSFAYAHVKGIVAFKIKKELLKNCDIDMNYRPLKHEPVQNVFILSICVKLY